MTFYFHRRAQTSLLIVSSSTDDSETSGYQPVRSHFIIYLFIYLLTKRYIYHMHMYCHVQREQGNKAQITGTNSCPLRLNHTATDTNTMQFIFDVETECPAATKITGQLSINNQDKQQQQQQEFIYHK